MTFIVGITGGIASGKTTLVNFLKKNNYPVHDSDLIVKGIYSKPKPSFIKYLKKTKLYILLKNKKIDKSAIREEIFFNKTKRKLLEKYIHKEVGLERKKFINKHKKRKSKIVFLDIPLLFEKKIKGVCSHIIFIYAPINLRKRRAIQRRGMSRTILRQIIKSQIADKNKMKKSDFVINTSKSKQNSYNQLKQIINNLKNAQK